MEKNLIIFMPSIEDGGVEKNLFIITNYLANHVKNIELITISKKFQRKFSKKIKFISPKNYFWNNFSRKKKFFLGLFLLTLRIIKNNNLVVFSFQANIYCSLLCKILGVKVIVRANSAPDGWSKNPIKFFLYKYVLNMTDKVIVNSLEFKKKIRSKFNINAICIFNPLNKNIILKNSKNKIKKKILKKKLNLVSVGRLVHQKNQITILRALNLIKNKIDFNLIIIGDGPEKDNLFNYIKSQKIAHRVQLLSYKKNPFNYIKSSDIFLLSSFYEGLPNVLLEAQVLKTYIISSNCPTGPREILLNGKAGSLFKVGDYNRLSKLIIDYSKKKDSYKYKKKIQIGYDNLHRFDYENNLKLYLNVVNSLIL
jgi:glycosyltransferase involved in cell wall biosynthesis